MTTEKGNGWNVCLVMHVQYTCTIYIIWKYDNRWKHLHCQYSHICDNELWIMNHQITVITMCNLAARTHTHTHTCTHTHTLQHNR